MATVKSLKANGGIVGCVCLYMYAENGGTLSVGIWWPENMNKLVGWKECRFEWLNFVLMFCSFPNCLDVGKGHNLKYSA